MEQSSSNVVDDHKSRGIADFINHGENVEVTELDKSGNVQRRWLHRPGHVVTIVSTTAS